MKLYAFEGIGDELDLIPLAARRALDQLGARLSLEAWRGLERQRRRALVEAGSSDEVDLRRAGWAIEGAHPIPERFEPIADPAAQHVPSATVAAFGTALPISEAVWLALRPLDRYALAKVALRDDAARHQAAHREIVGHSALSTHLAPDGGARMVGISDKPASLRRALAASRVVMSREALSRIEQASVPKGDVLATARLAGIMAAKRTSELIPLCHPIALTKIELTLELERASSSVNIRARVEALDRTGVEMEALTAVSVAALTVYDMLKSIDRGMQIGPTELLEKSGGRSGDFRR